MLDTPEAGHDSDEARQLSRELLSDAAESDAIDVSLAYPNNGTSLRYLSQLQTLAHLETGGSIDPQDRPIAALDDVGDLPDMLPTAAEDRALLFDQKTRRRIVLLHGPAGLKVAGTEPGKPYSVTSYIEPAPTETPGFEGGYWQVPINGGEVTVLGHGDTATVSLNHEVRSPLGMVHGHRGRN